MLGLFGLRFWPGLAHGALYAPFRDKAGFTARSRASEIVLTGNFPYWLETVLGFSRFIKTPTSRRFIPFICSGSQLSEGAGSVIHTELRHMLPNSHVVSRTLCLAASRRNRRPSLAESDYRRPGQRQHGSQRTLDRDRGCLALVCVVNCRDDPLAMSTTLVRKYRAIFTLWCCLAACRRLHSLSVTYVLS
jgi:hypothetical protein